MNYHGKVVLFTGDRTATHECVPVVLPPLSAFAWKKCRVVTNRSKLAKWYADNPAEYRNLWDPTPQDGTRTELLVLKMLALALWAAKLYHNFIGAVMPHEMLAAIEQHLSSPASLPSTTGTSGDWSNNGCWWQCKGTTAGVTPQKGRRTLRSLRAPSHRMLLLYTGGPTADWTPP